MPRKKTAKRKVTTARKPRLPRQKIPTPRQALAEIALSTAGIDMNVNAIRKLLEALQLHIEPIKPGKKARKKPHEPPEN